MQQTLNRVRGISLREVLPGCRILGEDDIRVVSCCGNSQACQPGDLFAALVGSHRDGHDFADHAIDRGAAAVLAERQMPVHVPTCVVSDSRDAYARVCQALAGNPSQQLNVVGVTGTHGKSTTGILIAAVLEAAGHHVGLIGSLGYCDLLETAPASRTTPAPPELANWLARMQANGCSHAVVEMSSVALARRETAGMELDAAVLTNVRPNHLDYHGSTVNYRNAKGRLFEHLRPHGFAVINVDDAASNHFLSKLENPLLTVGMKRPAELTADVVERHKSEQTFLLSARSETVPVRTHMIGEAHVYNCLAAAAVGLAYGIDLTTVARGLESVDHVPGRMQRLEQGQPFGVFVDSAQTPDTLLASLKTLRQVTKGRLICVFSAAGGREKQNRPLMGRAAERLADLQVITSDNRHGEPPLEIIHDILDGYQRPARAHILPDRAAAICWALDQARSGDTVLIAGKGHQDNQAISDPEYLVNDHDIARAWLLNAADSHDPLGPSLRR